MHRLDGKVAIVTGSSSGIGLAVARSLAKRGCLLVLHGSRAVENAQTIIQELEQITTVTYVQASLEHPSEAAAQIIRAAIEKFSRVDILVNNAGIQHVCPVQSFPDEMWEKIISVNLSSCFYMIKNALPHMQNNNFGRIINVSSVHGKVGSINKSAYTAAKHGILGLSKVVALENAGKGITCNTICPGWVLTDLVQKQIDKIAADRNVDNETAVQILLTEKEPTKKFTTGDDIGEMVCFLASEPGVNITGAEFTMDGGWTAQ